LLVVYGPDLIGKTSLVRCLSGSLPARIRCLTLTCQSRQGKPLDQVWAELIDDLSAQLATPTSARQVADDPVAVFSALLRQAVVPPDDGQLLLILDDAHALWNDGDEATASAILDVMTGLLAAVPSLRLLFTLSDNAYDHLRHPLRAGAETFHLTPLSSEDAQLLITRPVVSIIRYDAGAVKRTADIASNHPYYLQLFCHALFRRCARDGQLNQNDVDVVLEELLHQPNDRFQAIWNESDAAERAALVGMSGLKGTHDLMARQELIAYLQRFDPEVPVQPILDALERLAERGVLVRMGALSYRFAFKFFSYWVEHRFDPADVLARMDWGRLALRPGEPQADALARHRWSVGNVVTAALGLMAVIGLMLWGLILSGVWTGNLFEPTPTPTVSRLLVDFITPVVPTPTVTPVPPTPTPTSPIIVVRTMPSIAFRARNVGGEGDLPEWQIFVMNTDGSNRQRLTFTSNEDITPAWSPDGKRIAYVSKRGDDRDIFVMPAPGADSIAGQATEQYEARAVNITQNPSNDWTEGWSPDSQRISFSSNRAGYWEIFIIGADGAGLQQITDDGIGRLSPVWSPDGKTMAYSAKHEGNWDVYTMPAPAPDGTVSQPLQERRLTSAEGNDLAPMYSPDGRRIAFESNRDGNSEIYVMNADGSNQRNLTNFASANDHGPVWSPDGRQILFYSSRSGNWDIFLMTADGKNVVNLTNTPDVDEQEPSWRP
jgi:hypothetical protein